MQLKQASHSSAEAGTSAISANSRMVSSAPNTELPRKLPIMPVLSPFPNPLAVAPLLSASSPSAKYPAYRE